MPKNPTHFKHAQPSLQPWHHQQQQNNNLIIVNNSMPIPISSNVKMFEHCSESLISMQQFQNGFNFGQSKLLGHTGDDSVKVRGKVKERGFELEEWKNKSSYNRNNASSKSDKKSSQINFVKRNQQNLKSYQCLSHNYSSHFNSINKNNNNNMQQSDTFVPLNANCTSLSPNPYKRHSINTTLIGYYDEQPFSIDNYHHNKNNNYRSGGSRGQYRCKSRGTSSGHNNSTIINNNSSIYSNGRKRSLDMKTRPKTSDFASIAAGHSSTACLEQSLQQQQNYSQIQDKQLYDRATITVGGYHLQKVLKIKEKLRQKLKRNSEKKDVQRGLYVKSAMKIEEQKHQNQQSKQIPSSFPSSPFNHQHSQHQHQPQVQSYHPPLFRSHKSKSNIDQSNSHIKNINKQKIKVDKWKQYMKLRQNQKKMNKSQLVHNFQSPSNKNGDKNKFFGVQGGSIYKENK